MGSQHIGFDELVYLDTPVLSLTIKGYSSHPDFPSVNYINDEYTQNYSTLSIMCNDELDGLRIAGDEKLIKSSIVTGVHYQCYSLPPLFFEQQRYELVIEPKDGNTVEFKHENANIEKCITQTGSQGLRSGYINFENDIGYSDFYVFVNGTKYLKLTLEVFPSKISYKKDYLEIIEDITAEVNNLIFDFMRSTYHQFADSLTDHSSPIEFYAIIVSIFDRFVAAADMVLRYPNHLLFQENELLSSRKIKKTNSATIKWIMSHSDQLIRTKDGQITCEKALGVKKYITYDTKENRIVKYMLIHTAKRLLLFKNLYIQQSPYEEGVIKKIDYMCSSIYRRCHAGFMNDVSEEAGTIGLSLVFNMAPGYRELYKYYLMLRHGLSAIDGLINLSVKNIAKIYEYWCFIKLNSLLRNRDDIIPLDSSIKFYMNQINVLLKTDQSSTVTYRVEGTGDEISLSYNSSYNNIPTGNQLPDNIFSIKKKNPSNIYESYSYIFDAKYRIDPEKHGPVVDTINAMHRYRDAIVYENKVNTPNRYERSMFGAYVLFPYDDPDGKYIENDYYKSIEKVNIGGLPFLPSNVKHVECFINQLIADSNEFAFERTTLPQGIEERLTKVDIQKRDVIVYSVKKKREFDSIYMNRELLIPVNELNDLKTPLRFVALLPNSSLGSLTDKRCYGEIDNYKIVTKRGVEYRKYNVIRWEPLLRPVEIREETRDYILTNTYLLENCSQISDLDIESNEEFRFYSQLKRITQVEVINGEDSRNSYIVGDYRIAFIDGQIVLLETRQETRTLCGIDEFADNPSEKFKYIMRQLKL